MTEEKDICMVVDEDIAHAEAVWDASSYDSDAMEGLFYRLMGEEKERVKGRFNRPFYFVICMKYFGSISP